MTKKSTDDVFMKVFMNSPSMMVITEAETGVVIEINKQFEDFYGYSRKEVIGKTLKQLHGFVNDADRDKIASYVMKNNIGKNIEIQERTKSGEVKWVSVSVQMLTLFSKQCFLGSGTDITEKKLNKSGVKAIPFELNIPNSQLKRILIADVHPSTRKGVEMILSNEFSEMEFGEASNAADVLKMIKEKKWDMLILDMDLPGRNGLEVLSELKNNGHKTPTLVFSNQHEEQAGARVFKAGAYGYLCKEAADEELLKAVQQILSGRKYITSSLAEQLATQLENPLSKAPHELLSDREFQTLLLIAKGKTTSEIAKELSLSAPTVSTYRARILEKMCMKSNSQLTSYAIRNNLV